jgi:hypothetical protein
MTGPSNMDITKLAYEKINERYSKAKYGDFNVIMDTTNGYINATKLCADGNKQFKNWLQNKSNKESQLMTYSLTGGQNNLIRGTYVHHKLIPHVAAWVSVEFADKVSDIINSFLVRERDDEIRALKGDKCDLVKMMQESEKKREESDKKREEAEKRAEDMLLKMTLQNEKTHIKLDETSEKLNETSEKLDDAKIDNKKLKVTLKRVEKIVEVVAEHVVPPAKLTKLHEQVTLTRVVNDKGLNEYKISCTQQGGAAKARKEILKKYPDAVIIKQIKPNANAKNFKHLLKEKYGSGKTPKLKINNQTITLLAGVTEDELKVFADEVIETAKAFGSDDE